MSLDANVPTQRQRKRVYEKLHSLLSEYVVKEHAGYSSYTPHCIQKMALNLERGIFNYTLDRHSIHSDNKEWNSVFGSLYLHRATTIYSNLNPESYLKNTGLIKRLLDKTVGEFELCNMEAKDIFPERYTYLHHEYLKKEPEVFKVQDNVEGILKCGKCRTYKTTYYQMQTRSADEPLTTFASCLNCSNRWRF